MSEPMRAVVHQDPASRELVDVLKDTVGKEAERVDHLIGTLTSAMVPDQGRRTR